MSTSGYGGFVAVDAAPGGTTGVAVAFGASGGEGLATLLGAGGVELASFATSKETVDSAT